MWDWHHQYRIWGLWLCVSGRFEFEKLCKQPTVSLTITSHLKLWCLCNTGSLHTSVGTTAFSPWPHPLLTMSSWLKNAANDEISVSVGNKEIFFQSQNYILNTWHSPCSTWDSASEMAHLWSDKNASKRKPVGTKSNINKPFIIILGQVQCLQLLDIKENTLISFFGRELAEEINTNLTDW